MRHPYVGDVGDYGKYGLLRTIAGKSQDIPIGVVWYLTDAQEHNNDGKHDGYLKKGSRRLRDAFRNCDPYLYDCMIAIRQHDNLNLTMVEDGAILPSHTAFYNAPVPAFSGRAPTRELSYQRWNQRDHWHAAAMQRVAEARCVFTDPDNGIVFADRAAIVRRIPSHKYSYWHEIIDYLSRGQSVIAYHHLGRPRGGHAAYIRECLLKIRAAGHDSWAIHYRRGTARVFFVIPVGSDRGALLERSKSYVQTWSAHAALIA